jgi:hypothetical protein
VNTEDEMSTVFEELLRIQMKDPEFVREYEAERDRLQERQNFFRKLAHVIHLGRCTRFPFGNCTRHEDADYFTPKDNDIASAIMRWLDTESSRT